MTQLYTFLLVTQSHSLVWLNVKLDFNLACASRLVALAMQLIHIPWIAITFIYKTEQKVINNSKHHQYVWSLLHYLNLSFCQEGCIFTEKVAYLQRREVKTGWCIYVPLEGLLLLQVLLHTPQKLKVASNPTHGRWFTTITYCMWLEQHKFGILKALGHLMISCSCMCVIWYEAQACKRMLLTILSIITLSSITGWNVCPLVKSLRR